MDERFRGKKHWIGLGALAVIFLCLILCGLGAMAMVMVRSGPACGVVPQVQPPVSQEGAAPPAIYYGPMGMGWFGHSGPFGFILGGIRLLFGVALFGLFLLLIAGLVRRVFWGPRSWCPPYWCRPPQGKEGEGKPQEQGPWAWHHHRRHWGPPPWWGAEAESAREEGKPDAADPEYSGPQE
jgi:hypothetical protein